MQIFGQVAISVFANVALLANCLMQLQMSSFDRQCMKTECNLRVNSTFSAKWKEKNVSTTVSM